MKLLVLCEEVDKIRKWAFLHNYIGMVFTFYYCQNATKMMIKQVLERKETVKRRERERDD